MRSIAADEAVALPIFAIQRYRLVYDSFRTRYFGTAYSNGLLNRLSRADACIFPHYGGRFSFTHQACRESERRRPKTHGKYSPYLSHSRRRMSLETGTGKSSDFYGHEIILLIGGDLHTPGPNITENWPVSSA